VGAHNEIKSAKTKSRWFEKREKEDLRDPHTKKGNGMSEDSIKGKKGKKAVDKRRWGEE